MRYGLYEPIELNTRKIKRLTDKKQGITGSNKQEVKDEDEDEDDDEDENDDDDDDDEDDDEEDDDNDDKEE